jgi:putative RecB family exonuclease
MEIYSHSRLSTFEQCPLKYKYKYIDKIITLETSIEAFLGKITHDTLEWLYIQVAKNKLPTIDDIITYYASNWETKYTPTIIIVKKDLTISDYFHKGIQFLLDYYVQHKPFNDNTLETEKRIMINLDGKGEYKLQGFIDRLVHNLEKDEFEVHDYKTSNSLPTQKKIDSDRQLALYSIAIKKLFGEDKEVLLVWHYLAHNTKIYSKRTNEQLQKLKDDTIILIKKIETTMEFPAKKTMLCNWCEYRKICPEFNKKSKSQNLGNKKLDILG